MTKCFAAFDFDGTITEKDVLASFLSNYGKRKIITSTLRSFCALHSREDMRNLVKQQVISSLFTGMPAAKLKAEGIQYAATLPNRYQPKTLSYIDRHKKQHHTLILVTASLDVYAKPAAMALGFDHVIAVELEADDAGLLTGQMTGPNIRGAEKQRRLGALLKSETASDDWQLWAYGNSKGDTMMLSMADYATWIGRWTPKRSQG